MQGASWLKWFVQRIRRRPRATVLFVALFLFGIILLRDAIWAVRLPAARIALRNGDLSTARSRIAGLLESSPYNGEALLLAANLARRLEAYDEAERYLRTYESHHGQSDELKYERTLLRAQTQGPSLEDDSYLRHELEPGHSLYTGKSNEIFEALTLGYRRAEQVTATLHCAKELLDLDPNHIKGLLAHGWALEHFNRMNEALDDYQKAAQLDPTDIEARLSLGEMLLNFNRAAEAVEHFEWLHEQRPDNVGVGFGRARCRLALDQLDDAARILDALLEKHDTQPLLLELRGHVAMQQEMPADAVRLLQEAVERAPYLRQANYDLSQCLLRQGQTAEARKYQEQVDRIDADTKRLGELHTVLSGPNSTAAQCHEAAVLSLRLGKEEDSVRWLQAALRKDSTLPEAHALMADFYERHGNQRRADYHRQQAQRK